jgi:hypothetical protein
MEHYSTTDQSALRTRDAAHGVLRCILAVGGLPAVRDQRRHSARGRDRVLALGRVWVHQPLCIRRAAGPFCLARRAGRYGDRFHRAMDCARSGSPAQLRGQPTLRDLEFCWESWIWQRPSATRRSYRVKRRAPPGRQRSPPWRCYRCCSFRHTWCRCSSCCTLLRSFRRDAWLCPNAGKRRGVRLEGQGVRDPPH